MDSKNPDELIEQVKEEQQTRGELAIDALQWFLDDNVGEFFPRDGVVKELSQELGVSTSRANVAISDTVGDIVDPVQQITKHNEKYVGVIEYQVFSDEGAYGYVDFDDRKGKRKRVVCARCVEKYKYDENVTHATQGEGSSDKNATWQQLLNKVTGHYADDHIKPPSDIEPGASLVSGTTIGGNTAYHTGNLADRGAVTITPSTTNQTIPEGFHNGNGFVEGDADLISDNIRDGVTIFGVTGNIDGIPDSALLQYLMDEGSGTTLSDNTENGNSGTLYGAGWQSDTDAVGGYQTTYDGTEDYGEVDGSESIYHNEFTVIITLEWDTVNPNDPPISKGQTAAAEGSTDAQWNLFMDSSENLRFGVFDDSERDDPPASETFSAGTKYQLIGRLSTDNVGVGVDGSIQNEVSRTVGDLNDTSYPITWMRDAERNDFYADGAVGTIEYHDKPLTDVELQDRYDALPWS